MKTQLGSVIAILGVLLLWWLWPQKTMLSDSEYQLALALYRVCNQSSIDGLAEVESLLAEIEGDETNGQCAPLHRIIAQAQSGRWEDAAKACRQILDDQVKPASSS